MLKQLIILLLFVSMAANAQKTKTTGKGKTKTEKVEPTSVTVEDEPELTPMEQLELTLPLEVEIDGLTGKKIYYKDRKIKNDSARAALRMKLKKEKLSFMVYTKRPGKLKDNKVNKESMKLCINIVAKDTNLLYTVNDSICRDPEVYKLLFQKTIGDTVFMLIYVDAFSKAAWKPACSGGKETKLFFVRWNAPKGKAIWKTKTIASCIKTITNMTKTPITDWDKESVLEVSYHKGSGFIDLKFDPAHPELGMQSANDAEAK